MSEPGANPKLQVDDSWKQQAAAEKEKLSAQPRAAAPRQDAAPDPAPTPPPAGDAPTPAAADRAEKGPATPRQIPPATFDLMVEQYVTQILIALGGIPHPSSGKRLRDMDVAKHYIDMLGVLETKTKGNLTADEDRLLSTALYQMRMNYVNASRGR